GRDCWAGRPPPARCSGAVECPLPIHWPFRNGGRGLSPGSSSQSSPDPGQLPRSPSPCPSPPLGERVQGRVKGLLRRHTAERQTRPQLSSSAACSVFPVPVRPLASMQNLVRIVWSSKIRFMNSYQNEKRNGAILPKTRSLVLLTVLAGATAFQRTEAAANVVVWDAGARFADTIDAENRAGWKAVPTELFAFEADPPKAASDPGHYGREYSFKGDA